MNRIAVFIIGLAIGCTCVFATAASATTFDLIYPNLMNVTLPQGGGITLDGADFALLVNKGTADIEAADFFGATFTVVPSRSEIALYPFISSSYPAAAPVHPNEAVGSVIAWNAILESLILPDETFRNTARNQVLAFTIQRGFNSYAGPIVFDVTMTMGHAVVHFAISTNVALGDQGQYALSFPTVARVSSTTGATPTQQESWGRLKALYR